MNDEIRRIERRIAAWSQIPATHGEPIQVLRYQIGQEYQSHFDYFFHEGGTVQTNRVIKQLQVPLGIEHMKNIGYMVRLEVEICDYFVPSYKRHS